MKILHYINFILIIIFIFMICFCEEKVVSSSMNEMKEMCLSLEQEISSIKKLQDMDIVLQVDNIESHWGKSKHKLHFLVNHNYVEKIGEEILNLKKSIRDNDSNEAVGSINKIYYLCDSCLYFMGASFYNIL